MESKCDNEVSVNVDDSLWLQLDKEVTVGE